MNKYFFPMALLAFLSFSTVHAGSGISYSTNDECSDSQWNQALAQSGDLAPSAQEWFDGVAIEVTDLCVDGGNIRPVNGSLFNVAAPGEGDSEIERPVHWLKPVKGTESVCEYSDDQENCEWKTEYRELSTVYQVPVIDLNSESRDQVCTKTYQLPACSR